jgi:hypothetical protein
MCHRDIAVIIPQSAGDGVVLKGGTSLSKGIVNWSNNGGCLLFGPWPQQPGSVAMTGTATIPG